MDRQAVLIVAKEFLASNRISTTAALLFAQLLDHRNKRTGQCNPKRKTLARELGVSEDTVDRAMKALVEAGYVTRKRRCRFYQYEIMSPQNAESFGQNDSAKCGVMTPQNAESGPAGPLYEPYQGNPERPRAEARCRGGSSQDQLPNAPATPRKPMGLADVFDPLNGRFLTKTQIDQLTWASIFENNRRKNERELAEKAARRA